MPSEKVKREQRDFGDKILPNRSVSDIPEAPSNAKQLENDAGCDGVFANRWTVVRRARIKS